MDFLFENVLGKLATPEFAAERQRAQQAKIEIRGKVGPILPTK